MKKESRHVIKKSKNLKTLVKFLIVVLVVLTFLYQQNNMISITNLTIESDTLPKSFDGYKIVQLSDLHGKSFGKNQKNLVNKVKEAKPEIILFTGDLIDSRRYDETHSLKLMKQLVKITDVYYVTGNHEGRSGKYLELEGRLIDIGVKVLRNTSCELERDDEKVTIIGIDDPSFGYRVYSEMMYAKEQLEVAMGEDLKEDTFKILLSHRPELFPLYVEKNIDITFSGHAHGGQIRLPFLGGILAPGQGIFPKYLEGKYQEEKSVLIVNRGLGNSLFPQRIFNRPEIMVVRLLRQ